MFLSVCIEHVIKAFLDLSILISACQKSLGQDEPPVYIQLWLREENLEDDLLP